MLASRTWAVQMLDVAFSRSDVLLAGLQCEAQCGTPFGVDAHPDDAAWHRASGAFVGGEEPGMRTAEPHRHAESLSRTDGDVGAELSGRNGQQTRQRIGGDHRDSTEFVDLVDGVGPVEHASRRCRQTEQRPEQSVAGSDGLHVADHEFDAHRLGARSQDGDRLGVGVVVYHESIRRRLRLASCHRHRLGGGRRLVEQRRIGDVEPCELGDQRLEIQQCFEPALADLGLVRRVGGVPGRILEHVAGDHRGSDGAGVSHADQARHPMVPTGDPPEAFEGIGLGDAGSEPERHVGADRVRHRLREQVVDRIDAEHPQHLGDVVGRRSDVAASELVGLDERVQRSWGSGFGHGEASCGGSDFPGCHRYLRVSPGRTLTFPVGDHSVSSRVGATRHLVALSSVPHPSGPWA